MKRHLIAICLVFLAFSGLKAQNVIIPDLNFYSALLSHFPVIDTSGDGFIQIVEAQAYTGSLYVDSENISDLTGIEEFTSINELHCGNNNLSSLDVSNNTALTLLDCSFNNLTSLDVSANTSLDALWCFYSTLDTLNVSGASSLTRLLCFNNNLDSLNVSNNTALTELSCGVNNINSLDVSNNTVLDELSCGNNNLVSLDVSNNSSLTRLHCQGNSISNLDVTANTVLDLLSCGWNNLSSLNLSANTALTYLYSDYNNLNSLDVTNNTSLTLLFCSNNNLSSLDLSSNTALTRLRCDSNSLNNLDIRNGNNSNILDTFFVIDGNSNLNCVSVDDPTWSSTNWTTNVDIQTSFSLDCSVCGGLAIEIDSVTELSCTDSAYSSVTATGGTNPITYSWNTTPPTSSSLAAFDSIGMYTVTVSDSTSCSLSTGVVVNGPITLNKYDLTGNMFLEECFQPTFSSTVILDAFNDGCVSTSGNVSVVFSGPVTFDSVDVAPNSISGDTLTWNFSNWDYQTAHFVPKMFFTTDSTATITDTVCFDVNITPTSGDLDSSNNKRYYCYPVCASYDPNDKQVYPQGECSQHFTQKDQKLTYTIRFQNKGTAPAQNVYILDTLSADIDINSLQVVSQSHEPLMTEVFEDKIIKFRFDNIILPDSMSDPEGSKGYVIYEVMPGASAVHNTLIENSAAIYFDLNPPIITNTVWNTLVATVPPSCTISLGSKSIESTQNLSVYPNPFTSSFTVMLPSSFPTPIGNLPFTIMNILGQIQETPHQVRGDGSMVIDASAWQPGIYFLQIQAGDKLYSTKLLKQ